MKNKKPKITGPLSLLSMLLFTACGGMNYTKTVDHVDIQKFMGTWYVITGRTSFLEEGATNSVEKYTWNEADQNIDIDFSFHKDSPTGPLKSIPQKAWIFNSQTNAHWKVQPFWPLKFDYLVVAMDPNYEWTVIGVPSGSYIWIMARTPEISDAKMAEIMSTLQAVGYPTDGMSKVIQQWK